VLVSGGFTRFAEPVGEAIGFDRVVSNRLLTRDGRLTGKVELPIVGAAAKRQALLDSAAERGLVAEDSLAIGDGANDIPMIEAAGLGIAFHAKPAVVAAAGGVIAHNDLTALLYAQGYSRDMWEAD
jgi:phosphoserine phosphatase